MIAGETVSGVKPAPDPWLSLGVYGGYVLVPILTIVRFWGDDPFPSRKIPKTNSSKKTN